MTTNSTTSLWESVSDLLHTWTRRWDGTNEKEAEAWVCSMVAAGMIGLAGVIPLLIIPSNFRHTDKDGSSVLQLLLSFAVGGLLADVFLHLLPEAWTSALAAGLEPHEAFNRVGLCVLLGIFVFIIVEMLASASVSHGTTPPSSSATRDGGHHHSDTTTTTTKHNNNSNAKRKTDHNLSKNSSKYIDNAKHNNNLNINNSSKYVDNSKHSSNASLGNSSKYGSPKHVNTDTNYSEISNRSLYSAAHNNNNVVKGAARGGGAKANGETVADCNDDHQYKEIERKIEVVGYLNLIANGIDNFAHGLAVAGSFMMSYRTGVLTTTAILIHEVPHEIGDFAILLSSGFTRWEAAKAQLSTAAIGMMGALFTLSLGSTAIVGGIQLYILGFTAGAFLNISLVSVLPQLLKEERPAHSAAQMVALLLGTYTMASLAC